MKLEKQLKVMRDATMDRMPRSIIQVFKTSIDKIRKDQLKNRAFQIGDIVPNLPLTTIKKESVLLSEFLQKEFLVLNFYRGGWCPYCNLELREYERLKKDFDSAKASIIGISAEIPDRTLQTANKNTLTIPLLTDVNAKLMKEIGIMFRLDKASKQEYENFGMDFAQIHGNTNFELPVPAVYVINKKMEIVFIHFEEDYMKRLEPITLLNHLKNKTVLKQSEL
ncbi:peroxiredoxin-like family protein [Aquimarina spongiae]|uniref:thioredoxin-dependent peroxiredoxin n=1 Tax=Aquimarina spongiae TaxID=570521 RepID=A0A1M6H538_9FLAO|nr:peroxiredoxin-like family protein [Aquimarina spongiae]SHJ17367.1 Peroxiredoxin [Aquimarina spongiae]